MVRYKVHYGGGGEHAGSICGHHVSGRIRYSSRNYDADDVRGDPHGGDAHGGDAHGGDAHGGVLDDDHDRDVRHNCTSRSDRPQHAPVLKDRPNRVRRPR